MTFSSPREKRLWLAAALLVGTTYATLSWARTAAELLRERNLLRLAMVLVLAAFLVLVARSVRRARPGWREGLALLATAGAYAAALGFVEKVEEAMHFAQYGLLALLVHAALVERWGVGRALRSPALVAFLLTVVAGWGDEGIQHLLPRRYYDLRDVAFNATAGGLAIAAVLAREAARRRDRADP